MCEKRRATGKQMFGGKGNIQFLNISNIYYLRG